MESERVQRIRHFALKVKWWRSLDLRDQRDQLVSPSSTSAESMFSGD